MNTSPVVHIADRAARPRVTPSSLAWPERLETLLSSGRRQVACGSIRCLRFQVRLSSVFPLLFCTGEHSTSYAFGAVCFTYTKFSPGDANGSQLLEEHQSG